mmetsp:Transcript_8677/g.7621  ORF Transcript_8677/g.7621 Transcript_8677/m.7621 type:complete len:142 (+) Transcript_8677:120-545(+)
MGISDEAEKEEHLNHRESTLEHSEVKEERLSNILRIRYLLSQMNQSTNYLSKAYMILKESIVVMKKYSDEQRRAETGEEPGNPQEDLNLSELNAAPVQQTGKEKKGKDDKKKDDKKKEDKKKADKKKGAPDPKDDAMNTED